MVTRTQHHPIEDPVDTPAGRCRSERQRRGRQCADCAIELTAAVARPLPRRFPLQVCVRCHTARSSR
ncbi:hypothetical protein [Streptomyces sp. CC210A]|uniref:hypothetical protein n=1 Tax=Streptomyces sp. CC210A TaxID=2898184 RepID=UPI001F19F00B|nr:hypothetical protein [Streptomyces sp. CC210A]